MDAVTALEYKLRINKLVKLGCDFEDMIRDPQFLDFLKTKIGRIWMKKSAEGQAFAQWQQS